MTDFGWCEQSQYLFDFLGNSILFSTKSDTSEKSESFPVASTTWTSTYTLFISWKLIIKEKMVILQYWNCRIQDFGGSTPLLPILFLICFSRVPHLYGSSMPNPWCTFSVSYTALSRTAATRQDTVQCQWRSIIKLPEFPVFTSEADQSVGCSQRGVLVDIQTNFMDIMYSINKQIKLWDAGRGGILIKIENEKLSVAWVIF